ncbi:MAG: DUF5678 domain-containing protein [Rhodospirillaceae bacterium]|nr:DUF5678 domain-containing protein [Rhodospirillaceae bacterium]
MTKYAVKKSDLSAEAFIAPDRVSPTGWASSSRELETAWIKQHGHEYRGKWIALEEDHLIAFADTLKELLANLNTGTERKKAPFIQHLLSEQKQSC